MSYRPSSAKLCYRPPTDSDRGTCETHHTRDFAAACRIHIAGISAATPWSGRARASWMERVRRGPGADAVLQPHADQSNERTAARTCVDLRQRRVGRAADPADRRRWCALRLHPNPEDV